MRRHRFLALANAAVVALALGNGVRAGDDPEAREACERARAAVRVLTSGSFDERWTALDDAEEWIASLSALDGARWIGCRTSVVVALLGLLRREPDDRIVCRILDADGAAEAPELDAFLPDALRDRSPNVRRRALDALTRHANPATIPVIEAIWRDECRPWIRASAIRALAAAGDARFLEDFVVAARGDDPVLAPPALAALGILKSQRSLEALSAIASDPTADASNRALETLLGLVETEGADDALLQVAATAAPDRARYVVGVMASRGPDSVPWLKGFVRARDGDEMDAATEHALASIAEFESRDSNKTQNVTFSCSTRGVRARGVPLITTHDDSWPPPDSVVAVPPSDAESSRCWDAPGVVVVADLHPRVPKDASVKIADVFEWKGELWYGILDPEHICWMPAGSIAAHDGTAEPGNAPDTVAVPLVEFDVPEEELADATARRLVRLGLATILDEDHRVAALRIAADPADRSSVLELAAARAAAFGPVASGIDRWLRENAGGWSRDPEIAPLLPARDTGDAESQSTDDD